MVRLSACGHAQAGTCGTTGAHSRRMLKKAVQQGRSERRPEAYPLGYVEGLNDARTLHGKRRVLARRGWAGEKSDFFSILLEGEWLWRRGRGLQR
jgi:hypothetical protein